MEGGGGTGEGGGSCSEGGVGGGAGICSAVAVGDGLGAGICSDVGCPTCGKDPPEPLQANEAPRKMAMTMNSLAGVFILRLLRSPYREGWSHCSAHAL